MATAMTRKQSMSAFLQSYATDRYEWESPEYCSRTRFLWTDRSPSSPSEFSGDLGTLASSVSAFGSDTFSDMSISVSSASVSTSGYLTCASHDIERLEASMPAQSRDAVIMSISDDIHSSEVEEDGLPYSRILEWITSLFISVAHAALNHTIHIDDNVSAANPGSPNSATYTVIEDEKEYFVASTKQAIWDSPSSHSPVVKFNSSAMVHSPAVAPKSIAPDFRTIEMPFAVDYSLIESEQAATAKGVCMWGRRLERIPKVRIPGQKEAIYCFDERKQRQKLKPSRAPLNRLGTTSNNPTQILYRKLPGSPFVGENLPPSKSSTFRTIARITQGHALLQNVTPVRFGTPAYASVNVSPMGLRMPLVPCTNALAGASPQPLSKSRVQHVSSAKGFFGAFI